MTSAAAGTKLHSEPQLEYLWSYWATVTAPEIIGPLSDGTRVHVYVTAGELAGPNIRGRFRPVGGDWLIVRPDGIGVLDVRGTIELDDGGLIYTTYSGIAELGVDGYERFLAGSPPERVQLRITPRYYTAHADYQWVNRIQCIGVGEVDMQQMRVTYDIYALR